MRLKKRTIKTIFLIIATYAAEICHADTNRYVYNSAMADKFSIGYFQNKNNFYISKTGSINCLYGALLSYLSCVELHPLWLYKLNTSFVLNDGAEYNKYKSNLYLDIIYQFQKPVCECDEYAHRFRNTFKYMFLIKPIPDIRIPNSIFLAFLRIPGINLYRYRLIAALLLISEGIDIPLVYDQKEMRLFLQKRTRNKREIHFSIDLKRIKQDAANLNDGQMVFCIDRSIDVISFFIRYKNSQFLRDKGLLSRPKTLSDLTSGKFMHSMWYLMQLFLFYFIKFSNDYNIFEHGIYNCANEVYELLNEYMYIEPDNTEESAEKMQEKRAWEIFNDYFLPKTEESEFIIHEYSAMIDIVITNAWHFEELVNKALEIEDKNTFLYYMFRYCVSLNRKRVDISYEVGIVYSNVFVYVLKELKKICLIEVNGIAILEYVIWCKENPIYADSFINYLIEMSIDMQAHPLAEGFTSNLIQANPLFYTKNKLKNIAIYIKSRLKTNTKEPATINFNNYLITRTIYRTISSIIIIKTMLEFSNKSANADIAKSNNIMAYRLICLQIKKQYNEPIKHWISNLIDVDVCIDTDYTIINSIYFIFLIYASQASIEKMMIAQFMRRLNINALDLSKVKIPLKESYYRISLQNIYKMKQELIIQNVITESDFNTLITALTQEIKCITANPSMPKDNKRAHNPTKSNSEEILFNADRESSGQKRKSFI
ncbi:hypothetical protein NEPAR06_0826 [Nematocida parisii]|uniref:Uncharacterized protein n=1 Tax=Nematocida parisii (strain ERTm3) TaxID=935791 RepID=I3EEJ3_NEMP3|nr:uncharacterized protein NEPG_02267 [Nematocida parisii ERTm1]EIJ87640.1 hypothetical protein NEQG_02187 [Nematocida parisii ERTm3]KAI5143962.1 hypothetical protein NEPAR07_0959 [Nematocida parisii]EIJ92868.1 hypothetical protein NEPG_02267 [Nematocida parisii ERTm1]KAI5154044.1 hypothetical protein NEPAR06_0826 [Nematocida parisii]KAI5156847.1 hypothetical protein NEPAR05_0843 [Nematocida parisii]|eukprot:XP_013060094.1 hypothetical protein NEPG_02267 [Nematocida parisii ERTm1]